MDERCRRLVEAARALVEPAARELQHNVYTDFCLNPFCDSESDGHLGQQLADLDRALAEMEDDR